MTDGRDFLSLAEVNLKSHVAVWSTSQLYSLPASLCPSSLTSLLSSAYILQITLFKNGFVTGQVGMKIL